MIREERAAVVGAGGWGTALSVVLSENYSQVDLWVREPHVLEQIKTYRENRVFLPGIVLPENIVPSSELEQVLSGKRLIVLAVPSAYVREMSERIRPFVSSGAVIVNAAKGFDPSTQKRLSEVIAENVPNSPLAVISGPNHAEETGRKVPSATVVASRDKNVAEFVQDALMTPYFRVYTNPDIVGVELGGALKNIIAIAVGICDGLGYGDNTKAALMTRGLSEIARLGRELGANSLTFAGLSGVGDLIVTCTSNHSRNRRCGMALGRGVRLEEFLSHTNMVVEGVNACKVAYTLSRKLNVEMPITTALYRVLQGKLKPQDAVKELMARGKKHEIEEIGF